MFAQCEVWLTEFFLRVECDLQNFLFHSVFRSSDSSVGSKATEIPFLIPFWMSYRSGVLVPWGQRHKEHKGTARSKRQVYSVTALMGRVWNQSVSGVPLPPTPAFGGSIFFASSSFWQFLAVTWVSLSLFCIAPSSALCSHDILFCIPVCSVPGHLCA